MELILNYPIHTTASFDVMYKTEKLKFLMLECIESIFVVFLLYFCFFPSCI